MANEEKRYPSRLKNKKNRSNSILNMMIGLVFTLILITAAFIFIDRGEESVQEPESVKIASESEELPAAEAPENGEEAPAEDGSEEAEETDGSKEAADKEEPAEETKEGTVTVGGTITREDSSDPIVEETVINTSWEPIGTEQTGEHVSVYQKGSADWNEKIKAISYATGLSEDNMYIMMVKNGGGPQKSIGVVQSKDESQKYRVHLEWIDGKGWTPVKMDVLKTLKGAY